MAYSFFSRGGETLGLYMPVDSGEALQNPPSDPISRTYQNGYCKGDIISKYDRPDKEYIILHLFI